MLNLVFPVFNAIDDGLQLFLPLIVRSCLWGTVAGAAAMALYAISSNQSAISRLKAETKDLRSRMLSPELPVGEYGRLVWQNMRASFLLLRKVIGPSLLSAIPVLVLAVWLDTFHGYSIPEGGRVIAVTPSPKGGQMRILPAGLTAADGDDTVSVVRLPAPTDVISIELEGEQVYSGNPFSPVVPSITKRRWWNLLLGSEIGYLAPNAAVHEIRLAVSAKRILDGLPDWAAGWETPFFVSVLIGALVVKFRFRIA